MSALKSKNPRDKTRRAKSAPTGKVEGLRRTFRENGAKLQKTLSENKGTLKKVVAPAVVTAVAVGGSVAAYRKSRNNGGAKGKGWRR